MAKRILFLLAALMLLAAGLYLRSSNARAARVQADSLTRQDASGANVAVSFTALKAYVATHMGASASFTLTGSYNRATAAAQAAAAASAANSQIYADAQAHCSGKSDSITQARCNQAYLAAHLANLPAPTTVVAPKLADYQYHWRAPLWTPDLAGALLLGSLVALVLLAINWRRRRS